MDDPREPGAEPEPEARVRARRHRARPAASSPARWSRSAWRATASTARSSPRAPAPRLEGLRFRHPLAAVDPGYDRIAPVYLADYATAEDGTGLVHSSPAYGVDDFNSCRAHGLAVDDDPQSGAGQRRLRRRAAAVRRPEHLEGERRGSSTRCATPAGCSRARPWCTAIRTAGATRRRSIYRAAAQWFVRMDAPDESTARRVRRRSGAADAARDARSPRSTRPRSIPRTAAPGCTT